MSIKDVIHQYQTNRKEIVAKMLPPAVVAPLFAAVPVLAAPTSLLIKETVIDHLDPNITKLLALVSFGLVTVGNWLLQLKNFEKNGYSASLSASALYPFLGRNLAVGVSFVGGYLADPTFHLGWLVDVFTSDDGLGFATVISKNLIGGAFSIGLNLALLINYGKEISELFKKIKFK